MQRRFTLSVFSALFALSLLFSQVLLAGWSDQAWCSLPLDHVSEVLEIDDTTRLIASGKFQQSFAKLYLTSRPLKSFAASSSEKRPITQSIEIKNAREEEGRYAVELAVPKAEKRFVLVLDADEKQVDLVKVAGDFLNAAYFAEQPDTGERGVLVDGEFVLALPSWTKNMGAKRWLGVDSAGKADLVARLLEYFPSSTVPDTKYLQQEAEAKLRTLGYSATTGNTTTLFGHKTNTRIFSRSEGEKQRWASASYFALGEWLYCLFVESRNKDRLDGFLDIVEKRSVVLEKNVSDMLMNNRRSVRKTSRVVAIQDKDHILRLVFVDQAGEPVLWYGPVILLQILDNDDAPILSLQLRASYRLSLLGEGHRLGSEACVLVARLPGDRLLRTKILKPPQ